MGKDSGQTGPRWGTGEGPRPARHVPWPEIFKHHISVLEGHFQMLDMVRKHTVEGTGNHRTICSMIEKIQESLKDTKWTERNFVPPAGLKDQVPIGSSSASMYPGYSPADITPGEAASEYGVKYSKARKEGWTARKADSPEYEVGQGRGAKRRKIDEQYQQEIPVNTKNGTESRHEEPNGADEDASAYFVIDTKPTPVAVTADDESPKKKRKVAEEKSKKLEEDQEETEEVNGEKQTADEETGNSKKRKAHKKEKKLRKAARTDIDQESHHDGKKKKKKVKETEA